MSRNEMLDQTGKADNSQFQQWQQEIASRLFDIMNQNSDLSSDFIQEHQENIVVKNEDIDSVDLYGDIIENNFIHNIKNLVVFLYKEFWDDAKEIILALAKFYKYVTWKPLLKKEWWEYTELPELFITHAKRKRIHRDFIMYLLGPVYFRRFNKWAARKNSKTKLYSRYSPAELLRRSPLFRSKIEGIFYILERTRQLESLRSMVIASYDAIPRINWVTDYEWLQFLQDSANDALAETNEANTDRVSYLQWIIDDYNNQVARIRREILSLKGKLDQVDGSEKSSIELEIRYQETLKQKKRNVIVNAGAELKDLKTKRRREISLHDSFLKGIPEVMKWFDHSLEPVMLEDQAKCETNRQIMARLEDTSNYLALAFAQSQTINDVMIAVSKFHKEHSDDDAKYGIPKYFLEDATFSCFSWTWLLASLLLRSGIPENDIYVIDWGLWKNWIVYRHAYLLVRLADGSYHKVDYAFNVVEKLSPNILNYIERRVLMWFNLGYNWMKFHLKKDEYNWLSEKEGRVYRVTEWITIFYLISLASYRYNQWNPARVVEYMEIAQTIDRNNPHIYELLWLAYLASDKERAMTYFRKCLDLNPRSPIANFLYWEKLYEEGRLVDAHSYLEYFRDNARNIRKLQDGMMEKCTNYLTIIKRKHWPELIFVELMELLWPENVSNYSANINKASSLYMKLSWKKRKDILHFVAAQINKSENMNEIKSGYLIYFNVFVYSERDIRWWFGSEGRITVDVKFS